MPRSYFRKARSDQPSVTLALIPSAHAVVKTNRHYIWRRDGRDGTGETSCLESLVELRRKLVRSYHLRLGRRSFLSGNSQLGGACPVPPISYNAHQQCKQHRTCEPHPELALSPTFPFPLFQFARFDELQYIAESTLVGIVARPGRRWVAAVVPFRRMGQSTPSEARRAATSSFWRAPKTEEGARRLPFLRQPLIAEYLPLPDEAFMNDVNVSVWTEMALTRK